MVSAIVVSHDYVTSVGGYAAYAEARSGSNGDTWGAPELVAGNASDTASGRVTWDSNPDDGVSSGLRSAQFGATAGTGTGTSTWAVQGEVTSPIKVADGTFSNVRAVELKAMTLAAAAVDWESLTVTFYKHGIVTDSYTASRGPAVNLLGDTSGDSAEQILTITSSHTDNDQVVVTGGIRISYGADAYPGPDDVAAQVFAFSNVPI